MYICTQPQRTQLRSVALGWILTVADSSFPTLAQASPRRDLMLVLSRRVGEKIRIGSSIVVTVLTVHRNKARLGIEAPSDLPIFRQELFDFGERAARERLAMVSR